MLTTSEVVAMAWCDKTSFASIKAQTGLPEAEVIKIMQRSLKPQSFKVWRKRVSGRQAKQQNALHYQQKTELKNQHLFVK